MIRTTTWVDLTEHEPGEVPALDLGVMMEFAAAYTKVIDKLRNWLDGFIEMLPNLAAAVIVVVLFWLASVLADKMTRRGLARLNTRPSIRGLIATLIRLSMLFAGMMIALGILNLDKALTSILAGAGIVGLALGFAFQDLAANFISGVGLSVHRAHPFKVGDLIETNGVFGNVRTINLRTTELRTLDGKQITIPNKQIYQDQLTNHSFSGERRVELECGISYGDDLRKVREVAVRAIEGIEERDKTRDVELRDARGHRAPQRSIRRQPPHHSVPDSDARFRHQRRGKVVGDALGGITHGYPSRRI
jgi:small conductance mechanosensitive channel